MRQHPNRAELERYLLNQLSSAQVVAVEEHYFCCDRCLAKLERLDGFIQRVRSGEEPTGAASDPGAHRLNAKAASA